MFNTSFEGMRRVSIVRIYLQILLFIVSSAGMGRQTWAANVKGLDTGLLAPWVYQGIAKQTASKAACTIHVSAVERDYAGRFFQIFQLTVPTKTALNRTLELKQSSRFKSPSYLLSKRFFSFIFEMREVTTTPSATSPYYRVEIVGDSQDPSILTSFKVYRRSKVQEDALLMFDCIELTRSPAKPDKTN
jgi:hypothetical protein